MAAVRPLVFVLVLLHVTASYSATCPEYDVCKNEFNRCSLSFGNPWAPDSDFKHDEFCSSQCHNKFLTCVDTNILDVGKAGDCVPATLSQEISRISGFLIDCGNMRNQLINEIMNMKFPTEGSVCTCCKYQDFIDRHLKSGPVVTSKFSMVNRADECSFDQADALSSDIVSAPKPAPSTNNTSPELSDCSEYWLSYFNFAGCSISSYSSGGWDRVHKLCAAKCLETAIADLRKAEQLPYCSSSKPKINLALAAMDPVNVVCNMTMQSLLPSSLFALAPRSTCDLYDTCFGHHYVCVNGTTSQEGTCGCVTGTRACLSRGLFPGVHNCVGEALETLKSWLQDLKPFEDACNAIAGTS